MAHSLEVRVPILDHHVVEWAGGVPSNLKLKGREGKCILKKSLEPMLSDNILYRDKMGFAVPLSSWFRGPLAGRLRDALGGAVLADTGLFDTGYLTTLVDQHQSGEREHSAVLWSLLMFESFLRQVHDGAAPAAPSREPAEAAV